MLDRLYTLYVTVIATIKGYGDYFWVDVVEKIDEMGEQVRGRGGGSFGRRAGLADVFTINLKNRLH